MILGPIAAALVQMAISRTREYSADRAGSEICGNPLWLASALEKLQAGAARTDYETAERNPATAHMFIVNPLHANRMDGLFTTHPRTANRVAALVRQAQSMGIGGTPSASRPVRPKSPARPARGSRIPVTRKPGPWR